LREHSDAIPKPLVNVGYRPIVWHLMRYYAHYGHTEFILCLGYRGEFRRVLFRSDIPLDRQIDEFHQGNAVASLAAVRSGQSFHAVHSGKDGVVTAMGAMPDQSLWINGGFFVLRQDIFSYIHEGEELVEEPFTRLIAERKLASFRWDGFWQSMDTFKDKISFDRMEARGDCPWMIWKRHPSNASE
jgi:glucose-1-phosphate cytidylyltransferase